MRPRETFFLVWLLFSTGCGLPQTTSTYIYHPIAGTHPQLALSPEDINQVNAPDCWLVSVLAGTALSRPDVLLNMITVRSDSMWDLHVHDSDGNPVIVTVAPDTDSTGNYNTMQDPNQINWPKAFEVGFMKAFHKSNLLPGWESDPFVYLFGIQPQGLDERQSNTYKNLHFVPGQSVAVFNSTIGNMDGIGLVPDHAFTISAQDSTDLVLRNPWGNILVMPYVTIADSTLLKSRDYILKIEIINPSSN